MGLESRPKEDRSATEVRRSWRAATCASRVGIYAQDCKSISRIFSFLASRASNSLIFPLISSIRSQYSYAIDSYLRASPSNIPRIITNCSRKLAPQKQETMKSWSAWHLMVGPNDMRFWRLMKFSSGSFAARQRKMLQES